VRNQPLPSIDRNVSCEDWQPPAELQYAPPSANKAFAKQQLLLEKIITDKVVPRLLLANAQVHAKPAKVSDATAARINESIGEFAELVIKRDASASIAYFEALQAQGATVEALFQDLLAPVARRLGVLWDEDINDFMDVTRGVAHLQQIVHAFSGELIEEGRRPLTNRRALLMPLPGEQHSFGVSLIGEHFRREGWRVWGGPPSTIGDIVELVDGQWFDMVGLSISALPDPEAVASSIRMIRKASHNKDLKVLVGGLVFASEPALISAVGADATAADGREALLQVTAMIGPTPKAI
jgi:MerR family transcriptional regulator, light-induced transcriptional regulator